MNKTQQRPALLRVALHLAGALAFCLASTPSLASNSLRVGLYQNAPKIFSDATGKPAGLFVEVLNAIASREQWQLEYVPCEWDACLEALQKGDIDLMPDVAYSPDRDTLFDFNREAVLSNWSVLYSRDASGLHSIVDLDNKRIAVIRDSIQYTALRQRAAEFAINAQFIETTDPQNVLRMVEDGVADAGLVNRLYGQAQEERFGLQATHILVHPSRLHFAVADGRHGLMLEVLDRHLAAFKTDPSSPYHVALDRWVEPLENREPPIWLVWLIEALAFVLLFVLLHNLSLKKAVRRKTAELERRNASIQESEAMFRTLFETSANAMALYSGERFLDCNPAMLRMFGYPDRASMTKLQLADIFPPQQSDGEESMHAMHKWNQLALDEGAANFEWVHRRADGSLIDTDVTLVPMQVGGRTVMQSTIRDISSRKRQETKLLHLNRAMQTLSRVNHTLVHSRDEDQLLSEICRIIVEIGGYRLAWVGFAQYDDQRTVKPVAQYGFEDGYLENLRISWQDDQYGRGPTGIAIRTGKSSIARDIHNDPRFEPWREQALRRGYASSIALPLIAEDISFGAINIYSEEADAFDDREVVLLKELADDLAFGIRTQRMRFEQTHIEEERLGHEQRLQTALLQTIQAITVMVEARDPFTAGHQRRVSDLAAAIAEELHLDPVRIEGLRFGGMIHDIGNIYVPAEILNRPGKLTDYELAVVRSHVEVGNNIIKNIEFPWPIASMILNHHERLDGSGYPAGLKGEAIPLDARILAVADSVEAMLSHRPYRPSLGTEATLAELSAKRGTKFDPQVVDACLRLFRDKGYTLPA